MLDPTRWDETSQAGDKELLEGHDRKENASLKATLLAIFATLFNLLNTVQLKVSSNEVY